MVASVFSPQALEKAVADALPADARPGEHVIVGSVDQHGAQIVASFKLKERWELQGVAHHDWNGDNQVGAKVLLRW